jgi:putative addiction module killer protein
LNTLLRSSDFDAWLFRVADQKAKARILARLGSATFGNFGDCEPIGEGVPEMRIHSERDIGFITRERDRPFTFYWLEA